MERKSEGSMRISLGGMLTIIDEDTKNTKRGTVQGTLRWFVPLQEVNMYVIFI